MLFLLQRHSCPTTGSKFLDFSHWENLPPLSSPKVSSAARCLCCSPLGASSSWYLQVRINENKNFRLLWIKLRCNLQCLEKTYPVIPTKFLPPYSCLGFRVVQSIKEGRYLTCALPGHHTWWPEWLHEGEIWDGLGGKSVPTTPDNGGDLRKLCVSANIRMPNEVWRRLCRWVMPLPVPSTSEKVSWAHPIWNLGPLYLKTDLLLSLHCISQQSQKVDGMVLWGLWSPRCRK